MDDYKYTFTIFIPCYNRGNVVGKTLESVSNLEYRDFEVITVDDGSTDRSKYVIDHWLGKDLFTMEYIYQKNMGKHAAHNKAVSVAQGYFFITLDAGDLIIESALTLLINYWDAIPENEKKNYAGVSGLCLRENGEISGFSYPKDYLDSNYFDVYNIVPLGGEKRESIKTNIIKKYPFPEFKSEKLVRADLILRQISRNYLFRFINHPLEVNIIEKNGYTNNIFKFRITSPQGFRHFFKEEITINYKYDKKNRLFYNYTRYIRYSLHSKVGLLAQLAEINNKLLWVFALPSGVLGWLNDKVKKKILGINSDNG